MIDRFHVVLSAGRLPWAPIAVTTITALIAGLLIAVSGGSLFAVPIALALALILFVAVFPFVGAGVLLFVGPLIVGLARDGFIPVLRPNEALLLVVAVGVLLNAIGRIADGKGILPRLNRLDGAVAMLAFAGSLLPLLVLVARGNEITRDDFLYALVFAKYFVLYLIFRVAVRTEAELQICIKLILASGGIVAAIAILQVTSMFGVPGFLFEHYDSPFEGVTTQLTERATSTIASAFGLADVMAMCLAIVIALFAKRPRLWHAATAILFLSGALAAGSFSGLIGVLVAAFVAALIVGRLRLLVGLAIPVATCATFAFWPVISSRLSGFESLSGLPRSWVGRLDNLERFFWPDLFANGNWILGVRPAARVSAPESWRDWVYIESGHTWLLWTGGVALFITFLAFMLIAVRTFLKIARAATGYAGVAATAAVAGAVMIFVLMLFDPHLTVRGTADLFFPLVALALVRPPESARAKLQHTQPGHIDVR